MPFDATTRVAALPPIDPPVMTDKLPLLLCTHIADTTTRRSAEAVPILTLEIVMVVDSVVDVARPM